MRRRPPISPAAGSPEEYALLRLRLCEGLTETAFAARFGTPIPAVWRENAARLPQRLCVADENGIRLTPEGFLLSNPITVKLIG